MFVAGEAFLSYACSEDPALIEYALDKSVLISGPLTLVTLLRSFAMGWQALRQEENAKRIADMGRVLYERACKFSEHLAEVRKHLERSVNAFNAAVGSYETKLLPARTTAQGRSLARRATHWPRFRRSTSCRAALPRSTPERRPNGCRARSSSSPTTTPFKPATF